MITVLMVGVGALGASALELISRSPEVDRVVTIKRSPWAGPSKVALIRLGSLFQGHAKSFEHHQADLRNTDQVASLISRIRPDVVIHSAAVQSPRRLMTADVDQAMKQKVRGAGFGMWLPWHLLPISLLTQAIIESGISPRVVNAAYPDVTNGAIWNHYGTGPDLGAGNVEICANQVLLYVMENAGVAEEEIELFLVGSHALLIHGAAEVPHHYRVLIRGDDMTSEFPLEEILDRFPEPIDWRRVNDFSLFAASAVKNALALVTEERTRTHASSPNGLPGGYPVNIGANGVEVDLPSDVTKQEAISINKKAAEWEGIERIDAKGTIHYTSDAIAAMSDLGYDCKKLTFNELHAKSEELCSFFNRMTAEVNNADL